MAPGNDSIAARAARVAYGNIPNWCQASPGLDPASAHSHDLRTRFNELSVVRKKNHATRFPGAGKGLTEYTTLIERSHFCLFVPQLVGAWLALAYCYSTV